MDISDRNVRGEPRTHHFGVPSAERRLLAGPHRTIDVDGLPAVGQKIRPDDPLFSVIDDTDGSARLDRYKSFEEAYVTPSLRQ